jgi:hypothetical protein
MAICSCGLPACCCQPAVAGDVIYAISWVSLTLTWPLQALFTQSSPVHKPLLQAFPFPSTLGVVTLHPLSKACMFIYSSHGKWVFSPLLWSFPPTATFTSFPAPGCWALPPSPARPGLFIYSSMRDFPLPFFIAQCAPPSFPRVFIVLIAYYSVSLFSLGGGWSIQSAKLIWPRVACWSTAYHLAHLVHIFPSHLDMGSWQPGGPPGFSV